MLSNLLSRTSQNYKPSNAHIIESISASVLLLAMSFSFCTTLTSKNSLMTCSNNHSEGQMTRMTRHVTCFYTTLNIGENVCNCCITYL